MDELSRGREAAADSRGLSQRCGPGDLLIGKARTPEGDEIFNGLIDEVRIYNRVLAASEIADLASQE